MRIATLSIFAIAVSLFSGCATRSQSSTTQISLSKLPLVRWGGYRADPYIATAAQLQALGRRAACQELLTLSHSPGLGDSDRIVVLCRMLFTNRPTQQFRRANIGSAAFWGHTTDADWPLEPIELI